MAKYNNILYTTIRTINLQSIELINNTINKLIEKNTLMKSMIKYKYNKINNIDFKTINYDKYI